MTKKTIVHGTLRATSSAAAAKQISAKRRGEKGSSLAVLYCTVVVWEG